MSVVNNVITSFRFSDYFQSPILGYQLTPYESLTDPATTMPYMDMRWDPAYQGALGWSIRGIEDVGDYNGDGLDDILYERQFVDIPPVILISNGDGTFSESMAILGDGARETIGEAFSADFNGDGLLDIYGAVNGQIGYWPGIPEAIGSRGATGGDLLLLNNNNESFTASKIISIVEYQLGLRLQDQEGGHFGDLDNDGDLDVLSMEGDNRIGPDEGIAVLKRALLNDGSGNFTFSDTTLAPEVMSYGATKSARMADLDNDGIVDYVIASHFEGTVDEYTSSSAGTQVFFNNGNERFDDDFLVAISDHWIVDRVDQMEALYPEVDLSTIYFGTSFHNFVDINDDGYLDILAAQKLNAPGVVGNAGGFELYVNNGDRTFTDRTADYFPNLDRNYTLYGDITADITRFNFADIDGDGDNDFVMEQGHNLTWSEPELQSTVYPYIMLNEGGKFYPISLDQVPDLYLANAMVGFGGMHTGDFNGDGLIDIVSVGGADTSGNFAADRDSPNDGVWVHFGKRGVDAHISTLRGTGQNDTLLGNLETKIYVPGKGSDSVVGTDAIDKALYWDALDNYSIAADASGGYWIESSDGVDHLVGIDRLEFTNTSIALDLDGRAGQTAKILGAVFGAESVVNKEYAGIGLSLLDGGMSYEALAGLAISVTDASTHDAICELLWKNVVGVPAEAADIAPYVQMLDNENISVSELVVLAADTALNTQNIDLVGLSTTGFEYTPVA